VNWKVATRTLSSFAAITSLRGESGSRLILVEGNVRGQDIGSFVNDVRGLFERKAIALPAGVPR
jgi:Cu/Ag efflux pump CusA